MIRVRVSLARTWSLQEGYTLDEGVVQAAVKACCRAGRPSEAEAILVKSLDRGVVPEVGCFFARGKSYSVPGSAAAVRKGNRRVYLTPQEEPMVDPLRTAPPFWRRYYL